MVIPGTSGVQFTSHLTHFFQQPGLNRHVDIFLLRLKNEVAPGYLFPDFRQPADDGGRLRPGDDTLFIQHFYVGDAAIDIMAVETPVKGK